MSETPHIDELREIAQKIDALCAGPHPGLASWREWLDFQLERIRPFLPKEKK